MHAFLQPLQPKIASVLQPLPSVLRQTFQPVWERAAQAVHFIMAVDVLAGLFNGIFFPLLFKPSILASSGDHLSS